MTRFQDDEGEAPGQRDDTGAHDGVAERGARASALLGEQLEQAPYRTLGLALGVGVVVGVGMWPVVVRSLMGAAVRAALARAVLPALDGPS